MTCNGVMHRCNYPIFRKGDKWVILPIKRNYMKNIDKKEEGLSVVGSERNFIKMSGSGYYS